MNAQISSARQQTGAQNGNSQAGNTSSFEAQAEDELQKGTALTRHGSFAEAIPHLQAARGRVANEFAATFNLALCYVGTGQFQQAINVLEELRSNGNETADVENLLAQAYIGNNHPQQAIAALEKAASISPQNEKLYSLVADACMDHKNYSLGLKVIDIGLRNLPDSAHLHYQKAIFLTQMDELDEAKHDFDLTIKLAPGSELACMASAQEKLSEADISGAVTAAREGMKKGCENPALLTILGEALMRSGVSPGQPEFIEAQIALDKAVTKQPNNPASQIALGRLDLMAARLDDAIAHLEKGRQLDPTNTSVYANLAKAYQRRGNMQAAQDALAILQKLNEQEAARISSAPGDRKLGYADRSAQELSPVPHP